MNRKLLLIVLLCIALLLFVIFLFLNKFLLFTPNFSPVKSFGGAEYVRCGQEKSYVIKGPISSIGVSDTEEGAKAQCVQNAFVVYSPHMGCLLNKCSVKDACRDGAKDILFDRASYSCVKLSDGKWQCECTLFGEKINGIVYCTPCLASQSSGAD